MSVIIILLASTFPASAVLFIPAVIISLFVNSRKLKIFTAIVSIGAYLNINSVIELTYGISDRFSKTLKSRLLHCKSGMRIVPGMKHLPLH